MSVTDLGEPANNERWGVLHDGLLSGHRRVADALRRDLLQATRRDAGGEETIPSAVERPQLVSGDHVAVQPGHLEDADEAAAPRAGLEAELQHQTDRARDHL